MSRNETEDALSFISNSLKYINGIQLANYNVDLSNLVPISGITFIRYSQNRKIGKPNNLKFWKQ